ncbi:hypothetical protein [Agarivorans aestuarii]|uniref:hypothetical protein n=1 Tax=Agarivorans aestuarii TaxID=1563703 RepID=UPI001C826F3B|nr:hypothetical protein [Agarivorans aestuarii]
MQSLNKMKGKGEELIAVLAAAIIAGFAAGLIAFLYMKFGKRDYKGLSALQIAQKTLVIALSVTFFMIIGCYAGNIISAVLYPDVVSILDNPNREIFSKSMAFGFLIKSFLSLFFVGLLTRGYEFGSTKRKLVMWFGLYFCFVMMATLSYINFGAAIDYSINTMTNVPIGDTLKLIVDNFPIALPYSVIHNSIFVWEFILLDPMRYLEYLMHDLEGNQFYIVREFPTWSVLLISVYLVWKPTFGGGFSKEQITDNTY